MKSYSFAKRAVCAGLLSAPLLAIFWYLTKADDLVSVSNVHVPPPFSETTRSASVADQGNMKQLFLQPQESMPPCDSVNPFPALSKPCKPVPVSDGVTNLSVIAGDGKPFEPSPEFLSAEVVGLSGSGVVANLLRSKGRDLAGTRESSDFMLVDTTVQSIDEAVAAVKGAMSRRQFVVLDGADTAEGAKKVNSIMVALKLPYNDSVIGYGVAVNFDGAIRVAPLRSLANEQGGRDVDQLEPYLQIG